MKKSVTIRICDFYHQFIATIWITIIVVLAHFDVWFQVPLIFLGLGVDIRRFITTSRSDFAEKAKKYWSFESPISVKQWRRDRRGWLIFIISTVCLVIFYLFFPEINEISLTSFGRHTGILFSRYNEMRQNGSIQRAQASYFISILGVTSSIALLVWSSLILLKSVPVKVDLGSDLGDVNTYPKRAFIGFFFCLFLYAFHFWIPITQPGHYGTFDFAPQHNFFGAWQTFWMPMLPTILTVIFSRLYQTVSLQFDLSTGAPNHDSP